MGLTTPELITAEQLYHWPDQDARRELAAGVVQYLTMASAGHGLIEVNLLLLLGAHVRAHRLGAVFPSDTWFVLRRDPDTVRCPDVAFVAAGRLPAAGVSWRGLTDLVPDLAVEVRSATDRTRGSWAKVAEYLDVGVRLIWMIDPPARAVTAYTPDGAVCRLGEDEELDAGDVVPGFRCAVAELFEGVARE